MVDLVGAVTGVVAEPVGRRDCIHELRHRLLGKHLEADSHTAEPIRRQASRETSKDQLKRTTGDYRADGIAGVTSDPPLPSVSPQARISALGPGSGSAAGSSLARGARC